MPTTSTGEGGYAAVLPPLSFNAVRNKTMPLLYKVKSVSNCGTPFTVGKDTDSRAAVRIARKHYQITGRRPQIFLGKKLMAY